MLFDDAGVADGLAPKKKLLFVVNVDWFFMSHRLPIAMEAMRQGYEVHSPPESPTGRSSLQPWA